MILRLKKKINDEYLMNLNYKNNHFVLGTAQFGDPYGISNKKNRLKKRNFFSLSFIRNKIFEIDTSEDYKIQNEIKKNFRYYVVNTKVDISFFKQSFSEIKNYIQYINDRNKINILYVRNLENNFDNKKMLNKIIKLKG